MLKGAGIRELRYPIPWHRVEHEPGKWDWSWLDGPINAILELGLTPIADPLHHVSFPDWLVSGFLHPDFPALYCRFTRKLAERYEWIEHYTVFNEPLPTVLLCSHSGTWYPHTQSDSEFVRMSVNAARAINLVRSELNTFNPQIRFVHVDTCEYHRALDRRSEAWVEHVNLRRFLFHDLLLGRIDQAHPLVPYLIEHGFSRDDQQWFQDHTAPFDILGLDYYHHSEIDWAWSADQRCAQIQFPCERPRGFADLASDYISRYAVPILLSETNIGGTVEDRLTWLKFMEEQCETLAQQADFRGFCWFPSIDATDWWSMCTEALAEVCPVGIWCLDEDRRKRHSSILSSWYPRLARGEVTSSDLPAYRFAPPLDDDLHGYLKLMAHWTDVQDVPGGR